MLSLLSSTSSYKLNQLNSIEHGNLKIERKNLINIFKLVIKDLIESSSATAHNVDNLDKNLLNLSDFFNVFENILDHGFKGSKKGFYTGYHRNDYSSILDIVEKKFDRLNNNLKSIKDMSEIRSSLGKLRAWIRILVMQKQLAENFSFLIQEKDTLADIYDSESLMLSEEANLIAGLLIGLNGFDFSIDLKSIIDTLDEPLHIINYSNYLREKVPESKDKLESETKKFEEDEAKLYEILNQKHYLEEINKTYQSKLDTLSIQSTQSNSKIDELKTELLDYKVENLELKNKLETLETEQKSLEQEFKVKYDSIYMDQMTERETFINSKNGLDQMYIELQKKIIEESKSKLTIETELKTQEIMKSELESALKLMDHSLNEKQGTINKLREQLEQVKAINLDFNSQIQETESEKNSINTELKILKENSENIVKENEELKQKVKINADSLAPKIKHFEKQSNELIFFQKKRDELEVNLSIEKNWRQELQAELNTQLELNQVSKDQIADLKDFKDENEKLQTEISYLKLSNIDLEKTLEEMGSKLGNSVVKMEDIKEVNKQFSEFQWEQDDQVTICKHCNTEFSVARRKHHCRRCGRIFCHDCSNNKMPLPSFSKPMRVCDPCCDSMLQKCIKAK